MGLEVPGFVKFGMVTCFDNTLCGVEVFNILVCCSITWIYASVVIVIKFAASVTRHLGTYTGAKRFEVGHVWLSTVASFVGCHFK